MMSELPNFSLLTQPWVRVRMVEDEVRELSLVEVFEQAGDIRRLAGEVPTQDAAILRLLLAVMLGATRPEYERNLDECLDLWEEWSAPGGFPTYLVVNYLRLHQDRFDLFGATPFMQVADLHTTSGNASGLSKIIAEVPDGHQYFTTRAGAHIQSLSLAEAARWLVHCQQYDPAGIKTGAVGDERVKGGKGYSFGYPAWAGNLGVVLAERHSLADTLLLNLPLGHARPDDLPVWERPAMTAAANALHPVPRGPADAFTWQSRRIRLFRQRDLVVDVQISNGDRLPPQNLTEFEPMSGWRYSRNQSKAGHKVLMPTTHDSSRLVWQGLAALLLRADTDSAESIPPVVVSWMGALTYNQLIDPTTHVVLRAVGIEYGSNNSVIDAIVDDALAAPVIALVDEVLRQAAIDAVERASRAVWALVQLSRNLVVAAGSRRDDKAQDAAETRAFELGYAALDGPFRAWLARLTDPEQAPDELTEWSRQVRRVLLDLGQEMVDAAGPDAWQGRQITIKAKGQPEKTILMDSARAHLYFLAALRKAIGADAKQTDEEA